MSARLPTIACAFGAVVMPVLCAGALCAELPAPTIKRILEARGDSVERVRWGSSGAHLLIEIRGPDTKTARIERLSVGGAQLRESVEGEKLSVSPSGRYFAVLRNEKWEIRDSENMNAEPTTIPEHSERRGIHPGRPPAWSLDERFLAVVDIELYDPFSIREEAEEVDGVRIVDVGASLSTRRTTSTRITIVELSRPEAVYGRLEIRGLVVTGLCWDDRHRLLIAHAPYDDISNPHSGVTRWDSRTGTKEEIYKKPGRMTRMAPRLSPDGQYIGLALDVDNGAWSDFVSLVLIDLHTHNERRLTRSLYVSGDYAWSKDSRSIVFPARHGGFDQIYRVDLHGRVSLIASGQRRHFDLQLAPNGQSISYQTEDGHGQQDVRVRSLATGGEKVVRVAADPLKVFSLGKFVQDSWANGEGQEIFGFIVFPRDFDPKGKYPMLVDVHGGGAGSQLYLMAPFTIGLAPGPLEWHAWAALGYIVFVPDYRSTGSYGQAAVAARYRSADFGGIISDTRDIEAGVRHMLRTGYIDAERIALLGHSAGGARASVLLTRTSLFRAAILNEPTTPGALENLISMTTGPQTGKAFEGLFARALGGRLADVPSRYTSGFLYDGYRVTTPTLILLGGNRSQLPVPPLSSEALFSVLRQYDIPTRMLRFVDEGHNYAHKAAALLAFAEAERWLDLHMRREQTAAH